MKRQDELRQTDLSGSWEKIRKGRDAYKSARFYIWIGLLCGFSLIGLEHLLIAAHNIEWFKSQRGASLFIDGIAFVLGHLGMGFIVAAIAVFFYEWGAQLKETIELTNRLVGSLSQAKRMMEAIRLRKNLTDLNDKSAKNKLHLSIDTLIGGASGEAGEKEPHLKKAASNCEKLVLAISNIYENGAWADDQFIRFIADNLEEFVVHNAEAISNLPKGLQTFRVAPTAAQMADDILTAQMRAMKEGDSYDVISDITSWQGNQLGDLFEETRIAIEQRDVHVRRVFNLLPYIYSRNVLPLKSREILRKHLEASDTWRGTTEKAKYEVKVLWPHGYSQLKSQYSRDDISNFHFGLFLHDDGKESVRFTVTLPDLSDMTLCRQNDNNKRFRSIFDSVWSKGAVDFPKHGSYVDRVAKVFEKLETEKEQELEGR